MAAGVARCLENADFLRSEAIGVPFAHRLVEVGDAVAVGGRADDGAAELLLQLRIAADVVGVMMGVEDVRRTPT